MPLAATFDPSAACGGSSPSEGALWACAHPAFPQPCTAVAYGGGRVVEDADPYGWAVDARFRVYGRRSVVPGNGAPGTVRPTTRVPTYPLTLAR